MATEKAQPTRKQSITFNLLLQCFFLLIGPTSLIGYHLGVLNLPVNFIKEFYNATYTERGTPLSSTMWSFLWALTTTVYYVGCAIGCIVSARLAKRFGRRKATIICLIPQIVGSVLQTVCVVCKSPELLIIGRFLCGLSAGVATTVTPMFISEISPLSVRGTLVTSFAVFVFSGLVLSSVLGITHLLGTKSLWMYLLLVPTLPASISLVALFFLFESPRYLMIDCNDPVAAKKAAKFFLREKDIEEYMTEMEEEEAAEQTKVVYTLCKALKEKPLRKPMFITVLLPIAEQFTGTIAVLSYSAMIFTNAGVKASLIPYVVIGQNVFNVVAAIVAGPLMDRVGRKPLLVIPLGCIVVSLAVLTAAINQQGNYAWLNYISMLCVAVIIICFGIYAAVKFVVCSEIFLQGPRDLAMSIFGVTIWILAGVVGIVYPFLDEFLNEYAFLLFMGITIVFAIVIFFQVPETKNKSFIEISSSFK